VNANGAGDFVTGESAGAVVRTTLSGTVLYTLNGMAGWPVPIADLDGDGRTDYAFQSFGSGPNPPGYEDWFIVSLGATATQASGAWFGTGCGGGGPVPGLVMSGPPYFAWTRTIGYVNGPPLGTANVFVGSIGPPTSIGGGCTVYLDVSQPFSLAWSPALDAAGSATLSFIVPATPGMAGATARLQGAHVNAGGGVALTAAIDLLFGF
jgi:hypothetical protein